MQNAECKIKNYFSRLLKLLKLLKKIAPWMTLEVRKIDKTQTI